MTNKINFSALKTNNSELNKSTEKEVSPPVEIKKEKYGTQPIVQVSLGKKKNILKAEDTIKIKEVGKTEIKSEEKQEIKKEDIKKLVSEEEIIEKTKTKNTPIIKDKKVELENITKINKTEEVKIGNEMLIKEPENLFNNYESDFSVKQDSIIDKIKKLKDLPNTRPALVFGMLGFLIIGVSGLVFISPDDSYLKASVLGVEQVKEQKITEPINNIKNKDVENIKVDKEKRKKEKLENFLLNKKNKPNKLPENINKNIKNKSKEEKLKEMLLNAKKTK